MFCFNTFQWYIFYGWILLLQGHSMLVDLQLHWIVGNYKYFGVSGADYSYPQISTGMFNDFLPVCDPIWQTGEPTRSPSTKNQPFKNYRHLPIKMVPPLSKAFSWWPSQRLGFRRPEALRQHAARLALAGILHWNMLETEGRKPVKTATSPIWIIPEERLRKHLFEMEVASDFQVEHPSGT